MRVMMTMVGLHGLTLEILLQRSAWGTFAGLFCFNYLWYFLITWLPFYLAICFGCAAVIVYDIFVNGRRQPMGVMNALALTIAGSTLAAERPGGTPGPRGDTPPALGLCYANTDQVPDIRNHWMKGERDVHRSHR